MNILLIGAPNAGKGTVGEVLVEELNMVLVSNDMTKLYETTEKIAMYFDRFINFHYDHVITVGDLNKGGFNIYESRVGQAANIREIDLTKLDTEQRGSLVSEAYQFDLVYWVIDTPDTYLSQFKRVILDLYVNGDLIDEIIMSCDWDEEDYPKDYNIDGDGNEDCDCGCH